jgi:outer membrane protein assembly factor BamB
MDKILAAVTVALLLLISAPPMASTLPGSVNIEMVSDGGGDGDAPWPMFSHDIKHTGRSSFDASNATGGELWRYNVEELVTSSPAVDDGGTVFVGGHGANGRLCAVNPDGTLKWEFEAPPRNGRLGKITSSPAIGADGTVYVGSWNGYFYAVDSTGALKWRFDTREIIHSSPVVGPDGTVYFGVVETTEVGTFYALYPNGTEKWRFETGSRVYSSPAIGNDDMIYFGSHDQYLYALYSDGTLKWQFKTGGEVKSSPAIGDDGTIYVGSWDEYLYALNPDGTLKWRFKTDNAIDSSPAIAEDGTIYVGTYSGTLYAVGSDGAEKWKTSLARAIYGSPAIGKEGTIYIGGAEGDGKLYAVNPDGTVKWSTRLLSSEPNTGCSVISSPAINEDGTIYVGSRFYGHGGEFNDPSWWGYLHAIKDGIQKGVKITKPDAHGLYMFNLQILNTQNTFVIGGIRVKTDVISPEQVERVMFSVDGEHQYTDTTPPFTWRWNEHAFNKHDLFEVRYLSVTAHYTDGDVVASQYRQVSICNPFGRPTATGNDDEAVAPPSLSLSSSPDAQYAYPRELATWPGQPGCPYGMAP